MEIAPEEINDLDQYDLHHDSRMKLCILHIVRWFNEYICFCFTYVCDACCRDSEDKDHSLHVIIWIT